MPNKILGAVVAVCLLGACGMPEVNENGAPVASGQSEEALRSKRPVGRSVKKVIAPTLKVTDSSGGVFATSFPIYSTYDTFFALDMPGLSGAHSTKFEVLAPSGAVFQSTVVAFTAVAGVTSRVWSSMPVAGTMIEQYSMTGTWRVRAFIDASSTAAVTSTFILQ